MAVEDVEAVDGHGVGQAEHVLGLEAEASQLLC